MHGVRLKVKALESVSFASLLPAMMIHRLMSLLSLSLSLHHTARLEVLKGMNKQWLRKAKRRYVDYKDSQADKEQKQREAYEKERQRGE